MKTKVEQTEIGEIPEGWSIKKLSEVCEVLMGQSPPSSTYNIVEKGLPFSRGEKILGENIPGKLCGVRVLRE